MNFMDISVEQEIIGNLINDPDCAAEVFGAISPEDFYDPRLGAAFRICMETFGAGERLDARTLAEKAKLPPAVLAACIEDGWLSANIRYRAARTVELAHKRRTLAACRTLAAELKDLDTATISSRLSDISASILVKSDSKKVLDSAELCQLVSDMQEARVDAKGALSGPLTGLPTLDKHTGGLQPKRATLVAAGTGFGKTTLALNILANVAASGHAVLLISAENDVRDNVDRLCGIVSGQNLKEIESGTIAAQIHRSFKDTFWGKDAFISDNAPRNIDEVCGTICRYALQHGIKVAIVDYIGEISGEGANKETEEARLARYGQRLVDCARTMGVHIIILAQLNREGNAKGRPTKADLAGCFKLAQKAHTMLLFWQDDKQDVVTIEKNRQGASKIDIAVSFNRNNQVIIEQGIWLANKKEIYHQRTEV